MKKKLLFATIILVLLAGILYYISLPDYLVFNSMSFSNGANRDTELQVIVYLYPFNPLACLSISSITIS